MANTAASGTSYRLLPGAGDSDPLMAEVDERHLVNAPGVPTGGAAGAEPHMMAQPDRGPGIVGDLRTLIARSSPDLHHRLPFPSRSRSRRKPKPFSCSISTRWGVLRIFCENEVSPKVPPLMSLQAPVTVHDHCASRDTIRTKETAQQGAGVDRSTSDVADLAQGRFPRWVCRTVIAHVGSNPVGPRRATSCMTTELKEWERWRPAQVPRRPPLRRSSICHGCGDFLDADIIDESETESITCFPWLNVTELCIHS